MIDHASIAVRDYEASKRFYQAALAAIGYELLMEVPADVNPSGVAVAGFGADKKPDFWITQAKESAPQHLAFAVRTRALVDAFYRAALAAGGRDNGAPGVRAMYHPNYYGAFVRDPDGHNIEAVCHLPA